MISSPGVSPASHSGLTCLPHADTGNLRANVYPARPLFNPTGPKAEYLPRSNPGRAGCFQIGVGGSLHLFLEPADNLRSDLTKTDHAALSSLCGTVAGPGFLHAYPVPPVYFTTWTHLVKAAIGLERQK